MKPFGYGAQDMRRDLFAGITVGVVAVPLAMALAIAIGVPPQHGLYTAIVAGVVIALAGGTRFSISGPTAAFVVVLLPITQQYGLGGLLIATVMAGVILVGMSLARMGRVIEYIPYPVTMGFTAGISVVIGTLQIKDFLGLDIGALGGHYLSQVISLVLALPSANLPDLVVGTVTLAVLILWPRIKLAVPPHLPALVAGGVCAWAGGVLVEGFQPATIGSRFTYELGGVTGHGIPPVGPNFAFPWQLPDASGMPIGLSFKLVRDLLGPAFAIAMLGAIESLLCAVVADGIAGTRHNPNRELLGQGLGNVIAPFFGGISATAAIARTATNIRAGARSPIAALIHSLTVLLAIVTLAPFLSFVPMASLSALLLMVAWNISDAGHFFRLVRTAPRSDVAVLLTCFGLTVLFDMVVAIAAGIGLAALLFIRRMAEMTGADVLTSAEREHLKDLPEHVAVYDIDGPLFFGAAEKAVRALRRTDQTVRVIILDMTDVNMMDITGMMALRSLVEQQLRAGIGLVISGLSPDLARQLKRAGIRPKSGRVSFATDAHQAVKKALTLVADQKNAQMVATADHSLPSRSTI
jgi:SulP family sulfate permease